MGELRIGFAVIVGFVAFIGSLLLYLAVAADPVGLFVSVFLAGLTSSVLMPATQSRFIRISAEAALLGAALSHACLNLGNALGAWLGGAVIAAGFGYLSPGWVGIASACLGLVFVALSLWVSRRDRRRFRDTTGIPLPGDAVR